ncbi:MAG TPA: hypothetical protein VF483_02020 [Gemmatimonadaceae bacterium]
MIDDETRRRFLAAITERVSAGAGTIDEAHVFQSMKQGIMETGVAVVAASLPSVPAVSEGAPVAGADGAAQYAVPFPGENPHDRRVVYTARYRLTLKGPDRGKWEFTMHPEADAPLVTVDKVVRGVQQRSGDSLEPTKLTGEEIRMIVPEPQPTAAKA